MTVMVSLNLRARVTTGAPVNKNRSLRSRNRPLTGAGLKGGLLHLQRQ